MSKQAVLPKIEEIAERVAQPEGLEVVEIELKGGGKNQFLRISIDKPEGVTHDDCELFSRNIGAILDEENLISSQYNLEVSSPGVERKLLKLKDFDRFQGKKVKVVLREPLDNEKTLIGTLAGVEEDRIQLELENGHRIGFPHHQVERANLKFEW